MGRQAMLRVYTRRADAFADHAGEGAALGVRDSPPHDQPNEAEGEQDGGRGSGIGTIAIPHRSPKLPPEETVVCAPV